MANICATAGPFCGLLAARLDCDGTIVPNTTPGSRAVLPSCFVDNFTIEFDNVDAEEIRAAKGCITYSKPGYRQGASLSFDLCPKLDPQLNEILFGDAMVVNNVGTPVSPATGDTIGTTYVKQSEPCACGTTCLNPGVLLIGWWRNIDPNSTATQSYVIRMLPKVVLTKSAIGNDQLESINVTGRLEPNAAAGRGPNNILPQTTSVPAALMYEWSSGTGTMTTGAMVPSSICDCDICGYATGTI